MLERLILDRVAADRQGHSAFAPSSSAMWLGCAGSLIPNLLMPDTAGAEAAEGTAAHDLAEQWLRSGVKPVDRLGTVVSVDAGGSTFDIEIDEVMLDYVAEYVEWCRMLPGDHYVEQRVYFSELTPIAEQGGTADHAAAQYQRLVITDFKYGKGVPVRAEGNTQAQLYALGFFFEWDWLYDFQEIEIRICQPRIGIFDSWTISRSDLLAFAQYVRERAHAAWHLDAPRTPSPEACQWCKVRATCTAVAKLHHDMTAAAFDVETEVDGESMDSFRQQIASDDEPFVARISELSTEDMARLYRHRSMFEGWWKALAAELERRAGLGDTVPGYKLAESRSRRLFPNTTKAESKLVELGVPKDRLWTKSFISPAQAEEELIKAGHRRKEVPDLIADVVHKPVGKPTLVPESDKRPALEDVAGEAFGDLATSF